MEKQRRIALARLACLIVSLYCVVHFSSRRNNINSINRSLNLDLDYHLIEKKLCEDNDANHCNACLHYEDSIERHTRHLSFEENLKLIEEAVSRQKTNPEFTTKIVFLGDSITEQWNGRSSGYFHHKWNMNKIVFDNYFKGNALALGIMGDTFAWLHWRIRHGEVPDELNSKVWWIHIGTNNVKWHCGEDAIVLGIMHIVEEIRQRKPDAIIVVNAILPRKDVNSDDWKTIHNINQGLQSSVNTLNGKNVYFFDAFDAFFDKSTNNVQKGLHVGITHLSPKGYQRWAETIVTWTKENLDIDF